MLAQVLAQVQEVADAKVYGNFEEGILLAVSV